MSITGSSPVSIGWKGWRSIISADLDDRCDPALRDRLAIQQAERLRSYLPQLGLLVCLCTVIAAVALRGELPWVVQFGPPAIILFACTVMLLRWRRSEPVTSLDQAQSSLRMAPWLAAVLGGVAGFWCVSAFDETEQYYCLVAPVFLTIAVTLASNCLDSVPRAATVLIATASLPIVLTLAAYDNLTLRAVALMVVVCGFMQMRLIRAKYAETIRSLELQAGIERLARTDPLTGLANRRSFDECFHSALTGGAGATLVAIDLDGFKSANDQHGHEAGDAILVEVAVRLRTLCADAVCLARVGGDEFMLLFAGQRDADEMAALVDAVRAVVELPIEFGETSIGVSVSIGVALSGERDLDRDQLVREADRMLYFNKRQQKGGSRERLAFA